MVVLICLVFCKSEIVNLPNFGGFQYIEIYKDKYCKSTQVHNNICLVYTCNTLYL